MEQNDNRMRFHSAAFLYLEKDGKVLLSKRFNTGHQDGNYSLVAGHIDPGETAQIVLAREVYEEAGLKIDPKDLKVVLVMHNRFEDAEYFNVFLSPTTYEGEPTNLEPERCSELAWFPLNELPPNIVPYVKQALESVQKGVLYDNFGW